MSSHNSLDDIMAMRDLFGTQNTLWAQPCQKKRKIRGREEKKDFEPHYIQPGVVTLPVNKALPLGRGKLLF